MRIDRRCARRGGIGLLLVLVAVAGAGPAAAFDPADEQGNHAAAFLREGVDARHLALGGAGAALADNVAAAYWNPAGLTFLRGWSVTAMASGDRTFDRRQTYAAAAYGTERFALALGWLHAGTDAIPGADAGGNPTGDFDFQENAIQASFALRAASAAFGVNLKVLGQGLGTAAPSGGDHTETGYGLDLGAQVYPTPFARIGLMFQDLFGELGGVERDRVNDIPATMRAGIALEPMDGFTLTTDFEKRRDDDNWIFHAGSEYELPLGTDTGGAVRLGVREGDFSGGFGFSWKQLHLDYAYVIEPEVFLDDSHRFSLTVDFASRRQILRGGVFSDRDNDGIPDDQDACPDLAEDYDSYEDFDGCPDLDNDEDGIEDIADRCPDEPEDMDGFQDEDGCPDLDNDGDGIPDVRDGCPDEPETWNGFQDEDGCPDVAISLPSVIIPFASGSATLPGSGAYHGLDPVEAALRANPALRLEIQGYTDSVGDEGANLRLSTRRAESVMADLVARGIDPGRLRVRGFGEAHPAASNDTAAGRARNRRIEFVPWEP